MQLLVKKKIQKNFEPVNILILFKFKLMNKNNDKNLIFNHFLFSKSPFGPCRGTALKFQNFKVWTLDSPHF